MSYEPFGDRNSNLKIFFYFVLSSLNSLVSLAVISNVKVK